MLSAIRQASGPDAQVLEGNPFTLQFHVDHGTPAQPISSVLGLRNLDLGSITIGAELTLGRHVEGQFVTDQSGVFVSVEARALRHSGHH